MMGGGRGGDLHTQNSTCRKELGTADTGFQQTSDGAVLYDGGGEGGNFTLRTVPAVKNWLLLTLVSRRLAAGVVLCGGGRGGGKGGGRPTHSVQYLP